MNKHEKVSRTPQKFHSGEKELILDLLRQALETFQAQSGMIAVRERSSDDLMVLAEVGLSRSLGKKTYLPASRGISEYVMHTGEEVVIDDEHPPPFDLNYVRTRDRCSACIPIVYPDGKVRGLITLNKKSGTFPGEQFPFIRLVSREIGAILKEMELKKERDHTIAKLGSISRIFQGLTCLTPLDEAFSSILDAAVLALGEGKSILVQTSPPPFRVWAQRDWDMPALDQEEEENLRAVLDGFTVNDVHGKAASPPWPTALPLPEGEGVDPQNLITLPIIHPADTSRRALLLLLPLNVLEPLDQKVLEIIENLSITILENISLFKENQELAIRQERVQIARELHDGLNQSLVAVRMRLEHLKHLIGQPGSSVSEISEVSDHIYQCLTQCIQESRDILLRLREYTPGDIPLLLLVKNRLKELLPMKNMRYSFNCTVSEEKLSPKLKYTIYYLLREAVSNAMKHSRADRLSMKLCRMSERAYLVVRDNGVGFNLEEAITRRGCMGLRGMEERVAAQQGRLKIKSSPGKGSRIVAGFDLHK